jgi:hypothetical protein
VFKLRDQGKDQGKIEENNYFQEAEKNLMMAKYQIENMVKVLEMTLSKKELGMIQCPGNARLNKPVKASIVVQMKKNVSVLVLDFFDLRILISNSKKSQIFFLKGGKLVKIRFECLEIILAIC